MLKRFANHGEALDFGRAFGEKHGVPVWAASVYGTDGRPSWTFVFGPSSVHLLPAGFGAARWTPIMSWYFGNCGHLDTDPESQGLLALADREPLPGKQEWAYSLCAAHTQGYTHEQMLSMAAEMERSGCGVWHAGSVISGRIATCPCGACDRSRAKVA